MKVILLLQRRKIVGLTGQLLLSTTSLTGYSDSEKEFYCYVYSYSFLFNFVNNTILEYYLGLLAAIIPKRSWINEIYPIKTHLGPIAYSGDLCIKDTL